MADAKRTVLVVDDEAMVRTLVKRVLVESGFTVLEASCGAEALRLYRIHAQPIDLLLTDLKMPGMSGYELAKRVVEQQLGLKIIYMSGFSEQVQNILGGLSSGEVFVEKPFSQRTLIARIEELLGVSVMRVAAPVQTAPVIAPASHPQRPPQGARHASYRGDKRAAATSEALFHIEWALSRRRR